MNQKTLLLISALVLIGAGSLYFWYQSLQENFSINVPDVIPSDELFPFGTPANSSGNNTNQEGTGSTGETSSPSAATNRPVAGFFLYENSSKEVVVRYTERETGHTYDLPTKGGTTERITNTTIPKVREAIWLNKNRVVLRYLGNEDKIISFLGEIKEATSTEGKITGSFLPENISSISPYKNGILYLLPGESGSSLYTAAADGSKKTSIYSSPLREWVPITAGDTTLLLSKSSAYVFGYLYSLSGGVISRVSGPTPGLTTSSNQLSTKVLVAGYSGGGLSLSLKNLADGVETPLAVSTFPEKCVFRKTKNEKGVSLESLICAVPKSLPRTVYPDAWYRGEVSLDDEVFEISLKDGVVSSLAAPDSVEGVVFDATNLSISPDGKVLGFIDKSSSRLFTLSLPSR
ncbi:MAG: hypothetical protein AAB597_01025 [Patescibacteria group bacterium]